MINRLVLVFLSLVIVAGCTKKSDKIENSIQYALNSNIKSLDPSQAADLYTNEVVSNIFETLMEYHYLKRPLEVQPLLAEAMPTVSKDGLIHTFKLKKGVKFQDSEVFPGGKGRDLVASDFVYSWKRLADPKGKGEGFWIFDGKIKGMNEWRDKLAKGEGKFEDPIEGLTAVDDQTLKITLVAPYYQLNYVLAMSYAAAVPHEAVEKYGEEFMNHPVGTGPFKFDSWTRGSKVVLLKNPTWHGGTYPTEGEPGDKENGLLADAGKSLPFVDKLVFHEIPEDQPRWLNFMKGTFDYAGIPKDNFDGAIVDGKLKPELAAKGIELYKYAMPDVVYISFNMEDPVVGKGKDYLRKAMALAYDTATSMKVFYNDRAILAQSPIGPDMDGYDPGFKNPYKEYNVEKAKEMLKKAGHPDGKGIPEIEYASTSSTTARQMAEYTAEQFAKIGIKMKITNNSWPQFQEKLRTKKAQMFGIAWSADYPDAENMLQLLYSKNISPGPNNANYQNKEFDALYDKARKLPPGPERTALYKQMRDIFVKDMPWIPTVHRIAYLVEHGWLKNLKRHETINGFYKYLRVDMQEKAKLIEKL
ncbi:MAG: ABC transporter substrate-binding protein [Bdellovibrionales bacterium]